LNAALAIAILHLISQVGNYMQNKYKRTSKYALRYILVTKPMRYTNFSHLFLEKNSTCFAQVFCPSSGV